MVTLYIFSVIVLSLLSVFIHLENSLVQKSDFFLHFHSAGFFIRRKLLQDPFIYMLLSRWRRQEKTSVKDKQFQIIRSSEHILELLHSEKV